MRPANYPIGFDYTRAIPGWEETLNNAVSGVVDDDEYDDDLEDDYWEAGISQPNLDDNRGGGTGPGDNYYAAANEDNTGGGNAGGSSANDAQRLSIIRDFLRSAGVSKNQLNGSLDELRAYLRGRLDI